MGPVLFIIYTTEPEWILRHHGVQFKMFVDADDTQLYFAINNVKDTITTLNAVVGYML